MNKLLDEKYTQKHYLKKRFSGTSTGLFTQPLNDLTYLFRFTAALKVYSQNGLMRLSFVETDEPNYFPGLEF